MTAALTVDEIAMLLRAHRADLDALGVVSLAVFGSVARGEARDDSDADVLVEFDGPTTFDRYIDLRILLEDVLRRSIDLATHPMIRERMRDRGTASYGWCCPQLFQCVTSSTGSRLAGLNPSPV